MIFHLNGIVKKKKIIEVNSYFDMSKKNKLANQFYSLISNVNNKASVGFLIIVQKIKYNIFLAIKISIKGQTISQLNKFKIL